MGSDESYPFSFNALAIVFLDIAFIFGVLPRWSSQFPIADFSAMTDTRFVPSDPILIIKIYLSQVLIFLIYIKKNIKIIKTFFLNKILKIY